MAWWWRTLCRGAARGCARARRGPGGGAAGDARLRASCAAAGPRVGPRAKFRWGSLGRRHSRPGARASMKTGPRKHRTAGAQSELAFCGSAKVLELVADSESRSLCSYATSLCAPHSPRRCLRRGWPRHGVK